MYPLKFIQQDRCNDLSAHLFTRIYKFYSIVNKSFYILRAEYHKEEVFALKFYCKKDRKSQIKYSKITNKGDVRNILITCLSIVQILLKDFPKSSFVFIASRTIDVIHKKEEGFETNQRFRVYRIIVKESIGTVNFEHFEYPKISGYMLINRNSNNVDEKRDLITKMFLNTYNNLYES